MAELLPHEIQERRIVAAALARGARQRQWLVDRRFVCLFGDQAELEHQAEHEIAPRVGTLGVRERVVVGRSTNHGDQQRDLRGVEFRQRFVEVELAAESESVNRAVAILPEVDFIDVRVEQIVFRVARIEDHRHREFLEFAQQRAAIVEEVALHELLRQRAAALREIAGAQIGPRGARNALQIESGVRVEVAIFDDLECISEQRRSFLRRHDQPILAVSCEKTADQRRFEAHETGRLLIGSQ